MANNKQNRFDPDQERVRKSTIASEKKRNSKYKATNIRSATDPDRHSANIDPDRYSANIDPDRYSYSSYQNYGSAMNTSSGFDTDHLSRTLEDQADSHVRRARRDLKYSTGPLPTEEINSSRRPSKSNKRAKSRSGSVDSSSAEEMYRARKLQRREAARWKRAHWTVRFLILLFLILDFIVFRFGVFRGGFLPVWNILTSGGKETVAEQPIENTLPINEQLLTVNEFSRPGTQLDAVNGLVIHYIGNPGTDAQVNRDYFENLKDGSSGVYASCNYIIGLDGTIIQCVPDNEVAYASGERNNDTLSIECCHPDESGAFTQETFQSLVKLTAKLCKDYNLSTDQILRHYDVNHKPCPKFFVDDPNAWTNFLESVSSLM